MKRDMDLLRSILLEIEKSETWNEGIEIKIDGKNNEEIGYHIFLLEQANLIEIVEQRPMGPKSGRHPCCLTWAGCEFLSAAKDDTRWNSVKENAKRIGAEVFEVILKGLISSAIQQITKPQYKNLCILYLDNSL
jgi:hypothetical protein